MLSKRCFGSTGGLPIKEFYSKKIIPILNKSYFLKIQSTKLLTFCRIS